MVVDLSRVESSRVESSPEGMVATIGMIVPDLFGRFGGYLSPSMNLTLGWDFFGATVCEATHGFRLWARLKPKLCSTNLVSI